MGRARRTYTDKERAAALALYVESGPTAVQAELGVPKATVTAWAKDRGIRTRSIENGTERIKAQSIAWEERRLTLAHRMGAVAEMALQQCENAVCGTEGAPSLRDAKDAATTMAILVDKAQLLTGAATSRQDQHIHQFTKDAVLEEARERALTLVPRAS